MKSIKSNCSVGDPRASALFALILLFAPWGQCLAARPLYPEVKGNWVGTYRTHDGFVGTVHARVTRSTKRSGKIFGTVQDDRASATPGPLLPLRGSIGRTRVWRTSARGAGILQRKNGRLAPHLRRVSGSYVDTPGGVGTFVLRRSR